MQIYTGMDQKIKCIGHNKQSHILLFSYLKYISCKLFIIIIICCTFNNLTPRLHQLKKYKWENCRGAKLSMKGSIILRRLYEFIFIIFAC